MSEFDKIVGYSVIKQELKQICDMINNPKIYKDLGAQMPKGLLISGNPGVGKSLMASALAKESGLKTFLLRRDKNSSDFINEINNIFKEANDCAPSIIILDDLDKFVVEDGSREEYVAVQACIDDVRNSDVYVVATINEYDNIPESLIRAGRFDKKINVRRPTGSDAGEIIKHYIGLKEVAKDLNYTDITKMLNGRTCAELETLLNEAALFAGYERKSKIKIRHIVQAVLRDIYGAREGGEPIDNELLKRIAYHEAGHVVISEVLSPNSIGLASVFGGDQRSGTCGFIINSLALYNESHYILTALGGKAASELKFGSVDEGSFADLLHVTNWITKQVMERGSKGISYLDVFNHHLPPSPSLQAQQENIIHVEIKNNLIKAKEIITNNLYFLDAIADALLERDYLLSSDIAAIRAASAKC